MDTQNWKDDYHVQLAPIGPSTMKVLFGFGVSFLAVEILPRAIETLPWLYLVIQTRLKSFVRRAAVERSYYIKVANMVGREQRRL